VRPSIDQEKDKKLAAAWETFKHSQPVEKTLDSNGDKNDFEDANDDNETPLPNIIDLNTADSATLVRLKGIGPATAGKIVARRTEKGPYTNVDQLMEVRSFPDAVFKILKEHLVITSSK